MYKRIVVIVLFLFLIRNNVFSQYNSKTFAGSVGSIDATNGSVYLTFPLTVSGLGNIDTAHYGLESVSLDMTFALDSNLEIYLKSPNGIDSVALSVRNNIKSKTLLKDFTNTIFTNASSNPIWTAKPPFTGSFLPDGILGLMNDGRIADGQWTLCIKVVRKTASIGTLNKWSITFSNTPAPYLSVNKSLTVVPSATCDNAPLICSFDGYHGVTSNVYEPPHIWTGLQNAIKGSCGATIQNNSFLTFIAESANVDFKVYIYNSKVNKGGIQLFVFDGGCGSANIKMYGCQKQLAVGYQIPFLYSATGLTPGKTYYLMFDGYSGDVCDYIVYLHLRLLDKTK